jgi:hypothetical protein
MWKKSRQGSQLCNNRMIRSATNNALYAIVFGMEGNINKNNFILTSK